MGIMSWFPVLAVVGGQAALVERVLKGMQVDKLLRTRELVGASRRARIVVLEQVRTRVFALPCLSPLFSSCRR